jgi:hypothetical protein
MLLIFSIYFLSGALFGLYFIFSGCGRIDAGASSAGLWVRLMWLPAAVLLWPFLLVKLLS